MVFLSVGFIRAEISDSPSEFEKWFADSTLRLDYIFSGKVSPYGKQDVNIALAGLRRSSGWYGRRHHLKALPLAGNGQLTVSDAVTGDTLYRNSFSTLFQEWITTDEATETSRSFENSFLIPMPHNKVNVDIVLVNQSQRPVSRFSHVIDPNDYLIADRSSISPVESRYIRRGDDPAKAIDVAILAEGYTENEMDSFFHHAAIAVEALLSHEPFGKYADKFNFIAVASPSADSGVSIPRLSEWKNTAMGSHFSTFYSDRYLTTPNVFKIHELLTGIPYEHIIILANTDEYGGGGIYNSYTLTTARHANFRPVVVHEFGHSFGGLADEYFYEHDDGATEQYDFETEPWEPNITTLINFDSKWSHLLPENAKIPTPENEKPEIGVFEGGGYHTKGIFRPADECRMRNNTYPTFCPACRDALERLILFYIDN